MMRWKLKLQGPRYSCEIFIRMPEKQQTNNYYYDKTHDSCLNYLVWVLNLSKLFVFTLSSVFLKSAFNLSLTKCWYRTQSLIPLFPQLPLIQNKNALKIKECWWKLLNLLSCLTMLELKTLLQYPTKRLLQYKSKRGLLLRDDEMNFGVYNIL